MQTQTAKIKAHVNSTSTQVKMADHEFAAYLRRQSGNNDWYWRPLSNANNFFTSKGEWIATVFYTPTGIDKIFVPNRVFRVGYLKKDKSEHFNAKRAWFVNAWRIVDEFGTDMVQPWATTKKEAQETARILLIKLQ